MTKHAIFSDTLRHGRLFELIRQDNMLKNDAGHPVEADELDLAEMQRFLKRANRSFDLNDDGQTSL